MLDRRILYTAAFVRALATGMVGVLLGIYLARLGFDPREIGLVVGAGLAGGAASTLLVTVAGDRFRRRPALLALALVAAAGAVAIALASSPAFAAVVAFLGMVNGMGRDRGASLVLEQAVLPATVTDAERTKAFAWYNVLQDAGHALGGLLAATPALLRWFGAGDLLSLRLSTAGAGVLLLASAALYPWLSTAVEVGPHREKVKVSPETRSVLWRISALFALDSVAGGFLTTALLSFFFFERFGASEVTIGVLFFAARVANALSHLAAAALARRIGLVNTMVFTHIPSSVLLMTVAFAPTFWVAALFFLLREGLVEMDVPTRQSYVMAVVRPEERTVASGVTHLVRLAGWAVAPPLAGLFMQGTSLGTPLVIGAVMKIVYDILLYFAFRGAHPPEELEGRAAAH